MVTAGLLLPNGIRTSYSVTVGKINVAQETHRVAIEEAQTLLVDVMVSTVVVWLIVVLSVNVPRSSAVVGVVVTT